MTAKTNLRQFPSTKKATVAPVKMSSKDVAAADAAEKLDIIKIDQLTAAIFGLSYNPLFKSRGFTMDHLAAAALSVATQHMAGVSEAAVASVAETYAKELQS